MALKTVPKVLIHGVKWIITNYETTCPECKSRNLRIAKDIKNDTRFKIRPLKCKDCGCIFTMIEEE